MPNPRGSILRLERGLDRATRVCGRIARPSRPSWKPSPLSVSLRRLARRGGNECVSLSATCEPQQVDPRKGRRLRTKKRRNVDTERQFYAEVPVYAIPRLIDSENDHPSHAWDELTFSELQFACRQGGWHQLKEDNRN